MEVAVAGSVAKFALNLIVQIATTVTTAINDEIGSVLGVEEELRFIKQEFEMMQVFLRGDSTKNVKDELMTTWIEQVKELEIDLEDCLQEASVHLIKEKNCLLDMCSVKKRNRVAKKIRVLKTRTIDVINRKQRYEPIGKENREHRCEPIGMENGGRRNDEGDPPISISNEKAFLVGLNEPKRILLELILKKRVEYCHMLRNENVISVVGMSGIGKTTLVREVYGCQQLRKEFKCFAWVTVQDPFNKDEFIEILANQILFHAQEIDNNGVLIREKTEKKVIEYLKENKYLIVLDGLSSLSEWDDIKDVLFMSIGSRIIVTTRYRSPLAESISHPSENIYEIGELSKTDAFDLFCNAVFKNPSSTKRREKDSEVHNQWIDIKFTKDMHLQADLIIESCDRLPFAIVIIGSYLATKPKTGAEWNNMHHQLCLELANKPSLTAVEVVFTLIYDGMPNHIKQCLLYLSVFHKYKEIRRSRIIRQWMANGYVLEGLEKMADDIGKGYFCDLMSRSLIQPSKMSTSNVDSDIKRCNVHNLIYESIIGKAKNESMVSVLEDENDKTMTNKARHFVITDKVIEKVLSNHRSVCIFGEVQKSLRYPTMKVIKVLDLEGTLNLQNRDLTNVGTLSLLKYLGLRGTKITKLPDSLGKLIELETLDIRNTAVVRLPIGLAKLKKLSYLRAGYDLYNNPKKRVKFKDEKQVPVIVTLCSGCHDNHDEDNYKSSGVRAPRGIGELRYLTILGMIDIGRRGGLTKELQNLIYLRKLAVTGFSKENGKTLAKVIEELKQLRSLVLEATDDSGLWCCLGSVTSPPKYLQSLKLYSPLGELPDWISSLENLEKIHLRYTFLTRGIKQIEKMKNLMILYMSYQSLKGVSELSFAKGTFPKLQVMILEGIDKLKYVSIKETSLERLELLKIRKCGSIKPNGVLGLRFLVQLKEMEVLVSEGMNEENEEFVKFLQTKLEKHPKKPILRVFKD